MVNEKNKNEALMNNFDERNIESIEEHIREDKFLAKAYGMFVDESAHGEVKLSEESRKICAKALLK